MPDGQEMDHVYYTAPSAHLGTHIMLKFNGASYIMQEDGGDHRAEHLLVLHTKLN